METQNPRLLRGFSHRGGSNFTQIFSQFFTQIFFSDFFSDFYSDFYSDFVRRFEVLRMDGKGGMGRNGPEWARKGGNRPECAGRGPARPEWN